jgi:hypothetical protein
MAATVFALLRLFIVNGPIIRIDIFPRIYYTPHGFANLRFC